MIHFNNNTDQWFAIRTRYKREKYVQKLLTIKDVHAYLPLQKHYRFWGGRRRIVQLPLISCYVFVKIRQKEYVTVLETENVLAFVKIANEAAIISEEEIDLLRRVVGDMDLEVAVEPIRFEIGDKVEIIYGSLTGVKGKLVETKMNKFVVIELQNIGYELRIKVQNSHIRRTLI